MGKIFDGDRVAAASYIQGLAKMIGLSEWEINLKDETTGDKSHAGEVEVVYGRHVAWIKLEDSLYDDTPEEFRYVCVHELLHCHFKPFQWIMSNVGKQLAPSVSDLSFETYKDQEEMTIDAIGVPLAKLLPLPTKDTENADIDAE